MAGSARIELVGVQNLRSAQARMLTMRQAFELSPRAAVSGAGRLLKAALKAHAPVGHDRHNYAGQLTHHGGELRDSIGYRTIPVPGGVAASFTAARHAVFVIGGTRPHEISAGIFSGRSAKRALWWEGASHPVGRVSHPGTRANDFRKPAWLQARTEVRALLRTTGRAILRGELAFLLG
jgi:hypothetical protein